MLGFFDASAQRVVGHSHDAAVIVTHFNQTAFSIVGKPLHAPFRAAFFGHPPKRVIAITLVLIGQQLVMHHQPSTRLRSIQQVGSGVVGEGFTLAVQAVLAGDDAAGRVVVQQLAVLRGGLLVEFADQVVGGVVFELLLRSRRHQRWLTCQAALERTQAATTVVFAAGGELALGAQYFPVQAVTLEVADDLAVEVDLVQMAAAVIQAIEPAAIGSYSLGSLSSVAWYPGQVFTSGFNDFLNQLSK